MSARTSDSIEIAVMRTLCKRAKGAFSRRVLETLSNGNSYVALDIDPRAYSDPQQFTVDYMLYSFLRKWKGWKLDVDPSAVAFSSWEAAEQRCARTNYFLNTTPHPYGALRFIELVQRKIEHVVGKFPPADIFSRCRWSSGSTATLKRTESDVLTKVSRTISVTRKALPHLMSVMDDAWLKALPAVPYRIVRGNRMVMVPKNAKTHRSIAAEPTGNAFLQQGVGRFIRARLKRFGVNLDDQTVNQELAFRARVDGLATVDLSSASDTLCTSTVRLLMPPAWYDLLSDLRCPTTTYKGKTYALNKFSSMGNAFTFELESLIFWAIARVCTEVCNNHETSVYGDDIIIDSSTHPLLYKALDFFGFVVNAEKSYVDGPFYESCGKQYHDLEDVTPPFQKEICNKDLAQLIRLHNRLYRWGTRSKLPHMVKDACSLILAYVAKQHPNLKVIPEIPASHPSDLGFLSRNCKPRRDGDYDCQVLVEEPIALYAVRHREVLGMYAYKLRDPAVTNTLPDGHVGLTQGARTLLRKQRIWASSLLS